MTATTIFPSGPYATKVGALTDTSKTEIFAVDDEKLDGILLVGLRVVDSDGTVNTVVTVHCQISSSDTERVLAYAQVADGTGDESWNYDGPLIQLGPGGTIDLTGGNGHHWFLTYLPLGVGSTAPAASLSDFGVGA